MAAGFAVGLLITMRLQVNGIGRRKTKFLIVWQLWCNFLKRTVRVFYIYFLFIRKIVTAPIPLIIPINKTVMVIC
jgi:hypothetical protein